MRRDRVSRRRLWRREGGNVGRGSPHHLTRGLGSVVVSSPPGSGRKWILCIFEVRKNHLGSWNGCFRSAGTPVSVFLSDVGAPQKSRGPGKTFPPPPPLDGPAVLWRIFTYFFFSCHAKMCTGVRYVWPKFSRLQHFPHAWRIYRLSMHVQPNRDPTKKGAPREGGPAHRTKNMSDSSVTFSGACCDV